MSTHAITVTIDTDNLSTYTDQYLATLWFVGQANPADISDTNAGRIAEAIGREIIRRFLAATPPELYSHQGHHAAWHRLCIVHGHTWDERTETPADAAPQAAGAL